MKNVINNTEKYENEINKYTHRSEWKIEIGYVIFKV